VGRCARTAPRAWCADRALSAATAQSSSCACWRWGAAGYDAVRETWSALLRRQPFGFDDSSTALHDGLLASAPARPRSGPPLSRSPRGARRSGPLRDSELILLPVARDARGRTPTSPGCRSCPTPFPS
jgi:hypothetical protein